MLLALSMRAILLGIATAAIDGRADWRIEGGPATMRPLKQQFARWHGSAEVANPTSQGRSAAI